MCEDPLQILPVEKWSGLEREFLADGPRSTTAFMVLERQKLVLNSGIDYGFKVYCPFGDVRNGMVAINLKVGSEGEFYEVIIQCPQDDTRALENALKTTKVIDWSQEIEVPFNPKHVANCVKRVVENKNLDIQIINSTTYVLEKAAPLFNIRLPDGFVFDQLSLEYADFVNSTWPHKYPGSTFYFELVIKAKLGYGLFKDGKLISWVFVRETGALLHLYTIDEERRKGYGELVLKLISNILIKEGINVVAICKKGNIGAAKLYEKLHFKTTVDVEWCTISEKKENKC